MNYESPERGLYPLLSFTYNKILIGSLRYLVLGACDRFLVHRNHKIEKQAVETGDGKKADVYHSVVVISLVNMTGTNHVYRSLSAKSRQK